MLGLLWLRGVGACGGAARVGGRGGREIRGRGGVCLGEEEARRLEGGAGRVRARRGINGG